MKREDLKKLELSDEVIDKLMTLHGSDIESHKATIAALTGERDTFKAQAEEATKQIEGFKGMDIEGVKKAASDWEARAKQIEADAAANLSKIKFDHALESALAGAKAKNVKAVSALLDPAGLKLNDDGSIIGLNEQLTKIKTENDFLFDSDNPPPRIVSGGNNQSVMTDAITAGIRQGAGLK